MREAARCFIHKLSPAVSPSATAIASRARERLVCRPPTQLHTYVFLAATTQSASPTFSAASALSSSSNVHNKLASLPVFRLMPPWHEPTHLTFAVTEPDLETLHPTSLVGDENSVRGSAVSAFSPNVYLARCPMLFSPAASDRGSFLA